MLSITMTTEAVKHGLLTIAGAIVICAVLVFTIRRVFSVSAELTRKLLHFSVIAVLTAWLYAFDNWETAEITMAVFIALVYLILLLTEKRAFFSALSSVSSERNEGELRRSLCASGFMFMLVTGVCWGALNDRSLALASIFAWGPGDAAAALIGKRYGKTKIGRAKKKSLEGSLSMFTLSWACVFGILVCSGSFSPLRALAISLLTALAAAAVELIVLNGLDTFFCPAAAMTVLCLSRLQG